MSVQTEKLGVYTAIGDTRTLTFDRHFAVDGARVWEAITEPDVLCRWLGEASFNWHEGGFVSLEIGGEAFDGRIQSYEAGKVLEFDWNYPDEPSTLVRFEVDAEGELTLIHSKLPADCVSYGPGWHAHLSVLGGIFQGDHIDWRDAFIEACPLYGVDSEELLAGG